jgi:microcystin-dependent protein
MSAVSNSPLVDPQDQAGMLRDLSDRLKNLEQTSIVPPGITAYCVGAVPNGWLLADGSAFDTTRYGQLAAYLGGGTLPDMTGRFVVGKDAATFNALLATGGVETVTLSAAQSGSPAHGHPGSTAAAEAAHTHSIAHTHTVTAAQENAGVLAGPGGGFNMAFNQNPTTSGASPSTSGAGSSHTHTLTIANSSAVAASAAHTNLPPYVVLNPIIKV